MSGQRDHSSFVDLCLDQLRLIHVELVRLKRTPRDLDAVGRLREPVRTIRAAAADRDHTHLVQVASSGADLVDMVLARRVPPSPLVVEALEIMVDAVRAGLAAVESDARERRHDRGSSGLAGRLHRDGGDRPAPAPIPHIGELLVKTGVVATDDVMLALSAQDLGDGRKLGQILVALGKAAPQAVAAALYQQRLSRAEGGDDDPPVGDAGPVPVDRALVGHLLQLLGELGRCHDDLASYLADHGDSTAAQALERVQALSRSLRGLADELNPGR
jgi:hypothetical protein